MPQTIEPPSIVQLRERLTRLETHVATQRQELDVQFVRISELQIEIDALQSRRPAPRKLGKRKS
jgi:uncharacterized coiled-coil protein SlyX